MTVPSAESRRNVYVQNDSGGFSIVPSAAVDRIIEADRNDDLSIVVDHQAILISLYGDDSFPARVLVGGSLTVDEDAEWIARATWKLNVPCGKVLLCGGFDPRALAAWRDHGNDWDGTVQPLEVPPGKYLVDVYTYRQTINGRFLDESWPVPLGKWFRREHADKPYPAWLVEELFISPELDPGHEEFWSTSPDEIRTKISVDDTLEYTIGYLVHLRPWDPGAKLSKLPGDGWFEAESGARVPARCPLGLITEARPR